MATPSRQGGEMADYIARANRNRKVLDFIQFGGPILTIGSTTESDL